MFRPAPELGVSEVEVRKVGLRILGNDAHTISIELGQQTPPHVLTERVSTETRRIPSTMVRVARVGCRVTFDQMPDQKRAKVRSFELVWPNSCSLQNDEYAPVIQRLLADHGIEPKPPSESGEHEH